MSVGGCVLWMVFCNKLCTPIWCRNSDELGGLRFILQCTLYPKDSDELEGLRFMGIFCNALCTPTWCRNSDELGGLCFVGGVSHHALHPNLVQELQ